MNRYNPKEIEPRWQKIWEESGTYTANLNSAKPKYIAMSMFNYPSGAGIHIGHAMNYTISDVKARFKRQQGYESYHPVGWDSFGLPAENYAIKAGVSPQESMASIIPSYHKQYKAMGWSNDWEKEIATHLPEYYKWTQWIFNQMHKHGLAYQDSRMQWWCDKCQTVLANEQVIDGKCWRHDGSDDPLVQKKEVKQWFFKITDYADKLLEAIDALDWTESVKLAQKNWIGKSVGAEIDFGLDFGDPVIDNRLGPDGKRAHITVFTTRPDTLYGATYLVLAPEHQWVTLALGHKTVLQNNPEVEQYVKQSQQKSELERQLAAKAKTGVKLEGVEAVNPINGAKIPMFVADYVLAGYGTGAIMAVPAHDERDYQFATKFELPIKTVIEPVTGQPQENEEFRRSIVALVRNPKNGQLLSINWGSQGGNIFIGGGIEQDEDIVATARREVAEETGYKNLKFISKSERIHHHYVAHAKGGKKRYIHCWGVFFELENDEQSSQKLESDEAGKFKVEWIDTDTAEHLVKDELHSYVFQKFIKDKPYTGTGPLINSDKFDGLSSNEATDKIVADLAKKGIAEKRVNYKMRDWSVSRQRYWGAPIPIINCPKCGPVLVPEQDLPVILPELDDFKPSGDGRSALARAQDWLKVDCPKCKGPAERETDTLDTYIDSSWYMYRYFDPHNQAQIFDQKLVKKWEPIDFYNGADHATAHLLYARFIGHFFKKLGLVNRPEPFKQFLFNGKVTAADGTMFSKSKGNGVDPLEIIAQGYGADALRTYLMFAAPLDQWARWDPQGVPGAHRFLSRLWTLVDEYNEAGQVQLDDGQARAVLRSLHQTIKKVTDDLEASRYNTAIAAIMGCVNELYKIKTKNFGKCDTWHQALEMVVALVAPFAPHIAEDLWHQLGHSTSVHIDTWPKFDEKYLAQENMTIVVQINGKVRTSVEVSSGANEQEVVAAAKADPKAAAYLKNKTLHKTIYVPQKLVNFVI